MEPWSSQPSMHHTLRGSKIKGCTLQGCTLHLTSLGCEYEGSRTCTSLLHFLCSTCTAPAAAPTAYATAATEGTLFASVG